MKSLTVIREEFSGQKCLPREKGLEVSLEKSQMEAGRERGIPRIGNSKSCLEEESLRPPYVWLRRQG